MTRLLSTPDACFTAAQRPCAQYFAHTDVTDTTSGRLVIHAEALAPEARWCVVPIYTIGPDPRHFASSRAAIEEPHMRGSK